jgi:hypothetical protein
VRRTGARIADGDDGDDKGGGAGNGFEFIRSAVSGAVDRDFVTDGGRGGTGGAGGGAGSDGNGGGFSILFDGVERDGSRVIDFDLRSVSDNLRRRDPAEEGDATVGAGDEDFVGSGNANFGCEEGTMSCARRCGALVPVFCRDGL